ncbi:MAG: Gfo/Idh/MocA family oxidoreductase, partial [Mesorhizobium sp.]|uniref:Gfo/Idh/MocA family protein n=1 Tax=Mesorhizobium sp. TaxID=1871066 RepID=UPI001216E71A
MSRSVKVAVLGACGWMGKVHTMSYQNIPFIFGSDKGTAEIDGSAQALEKSGKLVPNAKLSTDWRVAVADPSVELVDICLPDSLHHEVAKAALLTGKHVYCEKPLANTAAEARELAD